MFRLKRHFSILLCLLFALGSVLLFVEESEAKRVYVKGYYRKDGTYVRGHYRTAPDGNPYNNYSTPGNYNPNTGKVTGGNLDTYLKKSEKGGWNFPSQKKYTSPSASEILGEGTVAPSSKKSFTSSSKHSAPNNIQTILAEITVLRQEIANLQREIDRLRNKPVKAIAGNKMASSSAIQGEVEVTLKSFTGWKGKGSWISLTNGQIWEQHEHGYRTFNASKATIYQLGNSYKMLVEGTSMPKLVKRIK